jgi:hypothetical protein
LIIVLEILPPIEEFEIDHPPLIAPTLDEIGIV